MTTPIKFSKFESFDRTDDGEADIMQGEEVIGRVVSEKTNTGSFLNPAYRVVCYHVEMWDGECNVVASAEFVVSEERHIGIPCGYPTARKARSAALSWAKDNG